MDYKIGDRVRIRSDLEEGKLYGKTYFNSSMKEFCGKEFIIERENDYGWRLEGVLWSRNNEMIEPVDNKIKRPSYERQAVDNEGIVWKRDSIDGRSIEEITKSIQKHKESIASDESLLRRHRSLFSKK